MLPRIITMATFVYLISMVVAVFLPEIVYIAALMTGVHELKSGDNTSLANGNWTSVVMYAWVFSLLFGLAFVLGGIARAGFITLRKCTSLRQKLLVWGPVALCITAEISHWRGYVGPRHFANM